MVVARSAWRAGQGRQKADLAAELVANYRVGRFGAYSNLATPHGLGNAPFVGVSATAGHFGRRWRLALLGVVVVGDVLYGPDVDGWVDGVHDAHV